MRAQLILCAIVIACVGCQASVEASAIEGVWRSDRERTLAALKESKSLSAEKRAFLEEHLGELYVSFRGNEARIFFEDIPEAEVEAQTFEVLEENNLQVTIEVDIPGPGTKRITYRFAGDCIVLTQEQWGYDEYFCRTETSP